ncbi:hypothetical protein [Marinomonas pollencensis]|uniref:Uncharacterized protein n=1 Tax=Marinomonas pollencensis TaxID=491954 RepID=A0A3E0DIC8_9GAMM|nr:hypothetical protein [Marinomonas pollencensis]REG82461.1 hypothetical protein DFP81_109120 [Marinomonas pollencensis]
MPDLASQIEESVLNDCALEEGVCQDEVLGDNQCEPDEHTLISALRNQDDIPILMDIVAEKLSATVSQETQFSEAMESFEHIQDDAIPVLLDEEQASASAEPDTKLDKVQQEDSVTDRQDIIAQAIASVLEKRLPDLVQEVLQTMDELSTQAK